MTVTIDHNKFQLVKATFHMPSSVMPKGSNPMEGPGAELVRLIARAGWDVPGIDVEIYTFGQGTDVRRRVSAVEFETPDGKLRLSFGNIVETDSDFSYGLGSATIEDSLNVSFYSGGGGKRSPRGIKKVIEAISSVTRRLEAIDPFPGHDDITPEGDAVMRRLCHVDPIPAPADFPPLYAWVESHEAYRLAGFGDDPASSKNNYGLKGTGWRLASLGANDGMPADERHFDGYTYASDNPEYRAGQVIHRVNEGSLPVEIRLDYLNEVYVVDNAAYRHAWKAAIEKAKSENRDNFNPGELDRLTMATARTLVPYGEYDGTYEEPVVLIGRQTFSNEVRLMRGPILVHECGTGVAVTMTDEKTGVKANLFRSDRRGVPHCRTAARLAEEAERVLLFKHKVSEEIEEVLFQNPEPSLDLILGRP